MNTFSRTSPWFTPELRKMKTAGRVLERRVSKIGLTVHKIAYQEHQKAYSVSLKKARTQFYSNIISKNQGNSKQLFSTINHLTKPQTISHNDTSEEKCNSFITFFRQKVETIRSLLSSTPALSVPPDNPQFGIFQPLCCFSEISKQQVEDIIGRMKASTCMLDPFPTALVKTHIGSLSPLITKVINHSLRTGHVPSKKTHFRP